MRWVIAVLVGCAQPPPPFGPAPHATAQPVHDDHRRVTGRVLRDGEPVLYFGVTVTASCRGPMPEATLPVHSATGRFDVTVAAPVGDILIAGPGFAARCFEGRVFRHGVATELGDIAVERGTTIQGHVTDTLGQPVAEVAVTIGRADSRDELTAIARGNYLVSTDRDGHYRIDGVSSPGGFANRIGAALDGVAVAPPQYLPDGSATIDLQLLPIGRIDGVVHVPSARVFVVSVSAPALVVYAQITDEAFHVGNLPIGAYEVQVGDTTQQVVVRPGTATQVTFPAP